VDNTEIISEIAGEIVRYLMAHEKAADTLEGVAGWWITQRYFETSLELVLKALELLCQQGIICVVPLVDGNLLYSLNKGKALGWGGDTVPRNVN